MKTLIITAFLIGSTGAGFSMPAPGHHSLGDLLLDTVASEGGSKGLSENKVKAIQKWMDEPSQRTGEYINQKVGRLIHPSNHCHLHHNPANVAKALSGTGLPDEAILNQARLHKIADISHNTSGVDGYKITRSMRKAANQIIAFVQQNHRLPKELPAWVDESGPLFRQTTAAETTVETTVTGVENLAKLSKAITVAGGTVGVIGGAFQTVSGVKEIGNGEYVDGGLTVSTGTANTISGVALISGTISVATPAAAVAGLADGAKDIHQGIKTEDNERITVGSIKVAGSATMLTGAATGQPEVVLAGACLYGGAVIYDNRGAIVERAISVAHGTSVAYEVSIEKAGELTHAATVSASNAASAIASGANTACQIASHETSKLKRKASSKYSVAEDAAIETCSQISGRTHSLIESATDWWTR